MEEEEEGLFKAVCGSEHYASTLRLALLYACLHKRAQTPDRGRASGAPGVSVPTTYPLSSCPPGTTGGPRSPLSGEKEREEERGREREGEREREREKERENEPGARRRASQNLHAAAIVPNLHHRVIEGSSGQDVPVPGHRVRHSPRPGCRWGKLPINSWYARVHWGESRQEVIRRAFTGILGQVRGGVCRDRV